MIVHRTGRLCNQWCTGLDQYFFPLYIPEDYIHSEAKDIRHRHKSDSGNHCNHLDNSYDMDNLDNKFIVDKNKYSHRQRKRLDLFHNQWGSLYQSMIEYNQRIFLRIGLHILLRFPHLWNLIIDNTR